MRRQWPSVLLISLLFSASIRAQPPVSSRGVLEGSVINAATGAPIAGARVRADLRRPADPLYARTDETGHFAFPDLAPGEYAIFVQSPGFLSSPGTTVPLMPLGRGGRAAAGGAPAGRVTRSRDSDGALHVRVTVPLTAYAAVAGRVTDPYGVPMERCTIEIFAQPSGGVPGAEMSAMRVRGRQIQTDDKGEYRVAPLEPGAYYVVANKTTSGGNWPATFRATYYPDAMDLASAKPLALAAGQQARADIQIVRSSGVRVAGRLIFPAGQNASSEPRVYTAVALVPEGSPLMNPNGPFTSAQDEYELRDVAAGRYTLLALTREAGDPFGSNEKPLFGLMRQIEVGENDMDSLDLELDPLRDLHGSVTFAEGCAPYPLRILLPGLSPLSGRAVEAVSSADGEFVLPGITPGHFTVLISRPDNSGRPQVTSIQLGGRDVLKNGLDGPVTGDDSMRITVGCTPGRTQ